MPVTVVDLAGYVTTDPANPVLPGILADAEELVNRFLGPSGAINCPQRTYDLAVKELASELFARRNSGPGGVAQWGPDGQPVRLARDPLTSVRAILAPYRGLGHPG